MAEQYCRWDDKMKIISLRFSNVMVSDFFFAKCSRPVAYLSLALFEFEQLPKDYAEFESFQDDPMKRFWNVSLSFGHETICS